MSKRGCPHPRLPWGGLTPSGRFLQPHGLQGRPRLTFPRANMRELRASWPHATRWVQGTSWRWGDSGFRLPHTKDNDGFCGWLWGPGGHGIAAADRMEVRPVFPATVPQGNWLLLGKMHRHCPWSFQTQMLKQSQERTPLPKAQAREMEKPEGTAEGVRRGRPSQRKRQGRGGRGPPTQQSCPHAQQETPRGERAGRGAWGRGSRCGLGHSLWHSSGVTHPRGCREVGRKAVARVCVPGVSEHRKERRAGRGIFGETLTTNFPKSAPGSKSQACVQRGSPVRTCARSSLSRLRVSKPDSQFPLGVTYFTVVR